MEDGISYSILVLGSCQFRLLVLYYHDAYIPLVVVGPHARPRLFNVFLGKERQGGFGRDDFYFDFVILDGPSINYWLDGDGAMIQTERSSETIKGALMDATLPVVMSTTWVWPSTRSLSATKGRFMVWNDNLWESRKRDPKAVTLH